MRRTPGQLTPKEQQFVLEFMKDLNASAAAVRAGYSSKNPDRVGSEVLQRPIVAAAIQKSISERTDRVKLEADDILRNLLEVVQLRLGSLRKRPKEKCADLVSALRLLGQHLGMFTDKHEHTGKDGGPVPIRFIEVVAPAKEGEKDEHADRS